MQAVVCSECAPKCSPKPSIPCVFRGWRLEYIILYVTSVSSEHVVLRVTLSIIRTPFFQPPHSVNGARIYGGLVSVKGARIYGGLVSVKGGRIYGRLESVKGARIYGGLESVKGAHIYGEVESLGFTRVHQGWSGSIKFYQGSSGFIRAHQGPSGSISDGQEKNLKIVACRGGSTIGGLSQAKVNINSQHTVVGAANFSFSILGGV